MAIQPKFLEWSSTTSTHESRRRHVSQTEGRSRKTQRGHVVGNLAGKVRQLGYKHSEILDIHTQSGSHNNRGTEHQPRGNKVSVMATVGVAMGFFLNTKWHCPQQSVPGRLRQLRMLCMLHMPCMLRILCTLPASQFHYCCDAHTILGFAPANDAPELADCDQSWSLEMQKRCSPCSCLREVRGLDSKLLL